MKRHGRPAAAGLLAALAAAPWPALAEGAGAAAPGLPVGVALLAAAGAAAALAGALHLRRRLRAVRAERQQLEAEVTARTNELLDQRRETDRQRAAAEAARRDVGVLSDMGRDLMASLDAEAILATLCRSIWALIPVRRIELLRGDTPGQPLAVRAWDGYPPRALPPASRALDAADGLAARCIVGAQPLCVARLSPGEPLAPDAPAWAGSTLAVPLVAQARVIGAILVHAEADGAHAAAHLDMLRLLAGYVAGALCNADAYQRLQLAQARLVEREKLAALGALVAGIAHELNTPLGNGVLMASTLKERTERLLAAQAQGPVAPAELSRFCRSADEATTLLLRSLESAATLVSSFKQVAVDQTAGTRRRFELARMCDELAATFAMRLRSQGHRLRVEVAPGLVLDSHPGALSQVIGNLLVNALEHAYEGRSGGTLRLSAQPAAQGDAVVLRFSDDGAGIVPAHLPHVFEPFYTTRLGRGGSGLGLHICRNIVTSLLGGQIVVASEPGAGTSFEITVPRCAPLRAAAAASRPADPPARLRSRA